MPASRRFCTFVSLILLVCLTTARADVLSEWVSRNFPPTPPSGNYFLSDITFANGVFVAVGENGDNGAIVTSPNGVNWTFHNVTNLNSYTTLSVNGIGYGNGRFVGVGWRGVLSLSSDGTNWTQGWIPFPTFGFAPEYSDVVYGGGQFVAVGFGFTTPPTNTAFSSDGTNWVLRRGLMTQHSRIAYGNGAFLAVGPEGIVRSAGAGWTLLSSSPFTDIAFGNGIFVLTSATNGIYTRDAAAVTTLQSVTNLPARRVTFGNGIFFALNTDGSALFTSTNGTNWIARDVTAPPLSSFVGPFALASGNGTLVAVGYPNKISQSSPFTSVAPGTSQGELRISGIVGVPYRVEIRTNFNPGNLWISAGESILTNSPQTWADANGTNHLQRYYRTQLLP